MKIYTKIDIYVKGSNSYEYACSTMQSKTLKEAKARYCEKFKQDINNVRCSFDRR
jgi:hypothetical protein